MTEQPGAKGVTVAGVEKRFGDVWAVRSLDLTVDPGEFVVLLGPSGCGKTTVLRAIAGLEDPDAGEIRIGGQLVNDVEPAERDIAMVFQNYALYPHMSVRENMGFGLKMRNRPRQEIAATVERAAAVLGLDTLLERRPGQLSGGQRQRVALGRAMVREPSVFLFDEPLSNLDARLRLEMRAEIARLHQTLGTTMIYVTHDQVEAMTLGQRIAVIKDGLLQQYGPPLQVYREPANLFVATFIGSPPINTATGTISAMSGKAWFRYENLAIELKTYGHEGEAVLGVRPEAIALATDVHEVDFVAEIARVEPLGNEILVHLSGPGDKRWIARVSPDTDCEAGDPTGVKLDRKRLHVFAGADMRRLTPQES